MWTKCMWKKLYGNINYIRIRIWNFSSFILLLISSLSFLIMIDKLSPLRKLAVNMSYSRKHMKCLLTATFHEAIEILKKNDILKTHPVNHKCQMGWKWLDCDQSIFKLSPQRNLSLEVAGVRWGLAGESQAEACPPLHPLSSPTARGLVCEQALRPVCMSVFPLYLHLQTSMVEEQPGGTVMRHTEAIP